MNTEHEIEQLKQDRATLANMLEKQQRTLEAMALTVREITAFTQKTKEIGCKCESYRKALEHIARDQDRPMSMRVASAGAIARDALNGTYSD